MNHFRRVLEAMRSFGWSLRPDGGSRYARGLFEALERGKGAESGLLDRLLAAALIEARSCERLHLLEAASTGRPGLGEAPWLTFLFELERGEAGHAMTYLHIAEDRFGPAVEARLDWWLDHEAKVARGLPWRSAVH